MTTTSPTDASGGAEGTIGPDVVDIRRLYSKLGCFTYDPGFVATASCSSELTYIDGEEGILLHRGYPIQQLAENSTFTEVSYLLLNPEVNIYLNNFFLLLQSLTIFPTFSPPNK